MSLPEPTTRQARWGRYETELNAGLSRRKAAALRLPPLPDGRRDPLMEHDSPYLRRELQRLRERLRTEYARGLQDGWYQGYAVGYAQV